MRYNVEWVRKQYNKGIRLNFIYFWGDETVYLNQWYPCSFIENNIKYCTSEQYMMAHKAMMFNDLSIYKKILSTKSPSECQRLGREIKHYDPILWTKVKFQIVVAGNVAKFSQNLDIRRQLLATNNCILVEASPYDAVWGVKLSMDNPQISNPNCWEGENLLGFALMEVRDILQNNGLSDN